MDFVGSDETTSIATHIRGCLIDFQNVGNSMRRANPGIKQKVQPSAIDDELGRFKIWSGNAGAHRRGRSSLDYRLREASHIRDRVLELLQNLRLVLKDTKDIIAGDRVSWEDLSDSESGSSDNESQILQMSATTELEQLVSNMNEINTCLMRLAIAIRNPAPHDQFKKSTDIDVTHFTAFDIDHVRGKFPKAGDYLITRLGKAISRRRQYLRYREEHRRKLEHGLDQQLESPEVILPQPLQQTLTVPAESEHAESTIASSLPSKFKAIPSDIEFNELSFHEETLSQTSNASSTNDSTKLRPPPIPEQGRDGEPFECPLCFRFTSVQQTAAWHKHVYRDLQPYMCASEECEIPDRTYESRHEWFNHELQYHRSKWWECIERCNQAFHSMDNFRLHLQQKHPEITNEQRIDDLVRSCERHDEVVTEVECPLCLTSLPSLLTLRRHLGKHQEEISLFALPSHLKDSQADSDDEKDDSDQQSRPASEGGEGPGGEPSPVILAACFCTRANLLSLPGIGKVNILKDRIQYEHCDGEIHWEILLNEMKNCTEFTFRTIKIQAPMYHYRHGESKIIENEGWVLIEFLSSKDKDTAYLHIKACIAKIFDDATVANMTRSKSTEDSRSIPNVIVTGLTSEPIRAHVKFEVSSLALYDMATTNFWHMLASETEGYFIGGNRIDLFPSVLFEKGNLHNCARNITLTPENFGELKLIEYYLQIFDMERNGQGGKTAMPDRVLFSSVDNMDNTAEIPVPTASQKQSQSLNPATEQDIVPEPELSIPSPEWLRLATRPEQQLSGELFNVVIKPNWPFSYVSVDKIQFFKTLFKTKETYYFRVYEVLYSAAAPLYIEVDAEVYRPPQPPWPKVTRRERMTLEFVTFQTRDAFRFLGMIRDATTTTESHLVSRKQSQDQMQDQAIEHKFISEPGFAVPSSEFLSYATRSEYLLSTQKYRPTIRSAKSSGHIQQCSIQLFQTLFRVATETSGEVRYFLHIYDVTSAKFPRQIEVDALCYVESTRRSERRQVVFNFEDNTSAGQAFVFGLKKIQDLTDETMQEQSQDKEQAEGKQSVFEIATTRRHLLSKKLFHVVIHQVSPEGSTHEGEMQFFKNLFKVTISSTGNVSYYHNLLFVNIYSWPIVLKAWKYELKISKSGKRTQTKQQVKVELKFENGGLADEAVEFFQYYKAHALELSLKRGDLEVSM